MVLVFSSWNANWTLGLVQIHDLVCILEYEIKDLVVALVSHCLINTGQHVEFFDASFEEFALLMAIAAWSASDCSRRI